MRRVFKWLDNNGNKCLTVLCVAFVAMNGQGLMDPRWAFVALAVLNAIIDQSYRGKPSDATGVSPKPPDVTILP